MTGRPGRFIVLEGGEGAGKSGVAAFLADALVQLDHEIVLTREPGGTPEGLALRALLVSDGAPRWDASAELLLMAASRVQHVVQIIRPAMAAGKIVICDRYVGSTLAYQGGGRGLSRDFIRDVHDATTGGLWPDLTLLLDIDPTIGLARSRKRLAEIDSIETRFEGLDLDFHRRVRASFLADAERDPGRTILIDASQPQADVQAAALSALLIKKDGRNQIFDIQES